MKYTIICIVLALSTTAYGQQPGTDPHVAILGQAQFDSTGQRLQQVVVQLQIVEVSLTKLRRLGLSMEKVTGDPNAKSQNDQTNGNAQLFSVVNDGSEAQQLLESLRKDKLMKVLAEPKLAIVSGKTAVLNLGKELSLPKPQSDGSVAIEHRHDTEVEVTPKVLGDKVRLAIHGRLTELDYGHTVCVGKEILPDIRLREFVTCAELKSGQTLAIHGPTEARVEAVSRGAPYISELPYVGAMFRTVEEQRNEIMMLILVRTKILQSPAATAFRPADGDIRR